LDIAIFLYGPTWHHLDHLVPLSQHLSAPLYVTDEEISDSAKRFYPAVDIKLIDRFSAANYIVQEYSYVISCLHSMDIEQLFFFAEKTAGKKIVPIWCPHGQSDKGHLSGFMQSLSDERALLLYGHKMVDLLDSLGVLKKIKGYALLGNYRWLDYQTHRDFYDRKAKEALKRLEPATMTLLYAPTWMDSENSCSFLDAYHQLIDHLPPGINLIIKPHPNLVLQEHALFEKIREELFDHPHVLLLEDFPLILPLLACIDLYIGDASSIGYDFLAFDKPMLFLNQNDRNPQLDAGLFLFRCGIHITPDEYPKIYQKIEHLLPYDKELFSEIRHEVYRYAFGDDDIPRMLNASIKTLMQKAAYDDFERGFQ